MSLQPSLTEQASSLSSIYPQRARRGAASLEVVMATAVVLPLAVLMFLLGVKICSYVFSALSGTLSMPLLVIAP